MPYPKPNGFIAQMADQAEWSGDRACRTEDASLFDTIQVNKMTLIDEDTEAAMEICLGCPVMMRCLENATRWDVQHGIWGGMTYEQRMAWAETHRPDWLPVRARHLSLVAAA